MTTRRPLLVAATFLTMLTTSACQTTPSTTAAAAASAVTPPPGVQALLAPWPGPWGGVPPFGRFTTADLQPALEIAMQEGLAEIDRIAADPAPPTFANTIEALEAAGRPLDRVATVFGIYSNNLSDDVVEAVDRDISPKLAAYGDRIVQNPRLFARIAAVYESRERSGLSAEQQRLVWLRYTSFVRAGANLDAPAKARLSAINQTLAGLFTRFGQNILAEEGEQYVLLESEADLAGLPDSVRAAAAAAAAEHDQAGRWAVINTRSSVEPFLEYSTRRELREKVWRMFVNRGDNGDRYDNNAVITEILALRAERARLLGYPTHAHWRVEDQMARTPERALALLEAVWKPAVAQVHRDVAAMQVIADAEGAGIRIEPWDYRFYAEKLRKAQYDLDANALKPYLQLDPLREGMFHVAGELFGLHFRELPAGEVPVYHPTVRVVEVTGADGRHVGLWYFDPYARKGKRSGAWMNAYRSQERFDGAITTIVSNNANFVPGAAGEPVLISWEDATTLFHEFGHALHGLCSDVTYPSLSGTSVPRDYVEFPSQLLEHWLPVPEVLNRYARHHRTGAPMPPELIERVQRAETFNQGFKTVEYLASALVDLQLHLAGERRIDPDAFERETLARYGMPAEIVMRHRTPQFGHVFSGDGYSSGYYSYLWADTLTADAWEAFTEAAGPWDRTVAERLRREVFARGNTVDPAEAYRAFRGRDAVVDALMRKRGFQPPVDPKRGLPRTPTRETAQ
jgi:peptidyl-dipeptidase Dcp